MKLFLVVLLMLMPTSLFAESVEDFFDPQTAYELMREDKAVLLDVREEHEIASGMAEGAVWLPTSKIEANDPEFEAFLAAFDHNKKLIVYCASGKRAARVVAKLSEMELVAENMGGFSRWQDADLPVVIPDL